MLRYLWHQLWYGYGADDHDYGYRYGYEDAMDIYGGYKMLITLLVMLAVLTHRLKIGTEGGT